MATATIRTGQHERPDGHKTTNRIAEVFVATRGDTGRFIPEDPGMPQSKEWYQQTKDQHTNALLTAMCDNLPDQHIHKAAKNLFRLIGQRAASWLQHGSRPRAIEEYARARAPAVTLIPYLGDVWVKRVDAAESIINSPDFGADKPPQAQLDLILSSKTLSDKVYLRASDEEH